jgi:hypothetical protein
MFEIIYLYYFILNTKSIQKLMVVYRYEQGPVYGYVLEETFGTLYGMVCTQNMKAHRSLDGLVDSSSD